MATGRWGRSLWEEEEEEPQANGSAKRPGRRRKPRPLGDNESKKEKKSVLHGALWRNIRPGRPDSPSCAIFPLDLHSSACQRQTGSPTPEGKRAGGMTGKHASAARNHALGRANVSVARARGGARWLGRRRSFSPSGSGPNPIPELAPHRLHLSLGPSQPGRFWAPQQPLRASEENLTPCLQTGRESTSWRNETCR